LLKTLLFNGLGFPELIAKVLIWRIFQKVLNSTYYLPFGKIDDTLSPLLSRVRGRRLQLHP